MKENILKRNNVQIKGSGKQPILFAPGFGCDQTVWELVSRSFENDFQVILFDYVGIGNSDVSSFDSDKYGQLSGYVQDVLDVCSALDLEKAIFVVHSVGGMIGALASLIKPEHFSHLIMIGPSPYYLNEPPNYFGGFEREDLVGLLDMMDRNYIGWTNFFSTTLLNNGEEGKVQKELEDRFCSTDPYIARTFAEACFFADNRDDLPKISLPTLILQCSNDVIAPTAVGEYMHQNMPLSSIKYMEAIGHCPHMTHPEETIYLIRQYLNGI